jgi:prevent-host-death family protein
MTPTAVVHARDLRNHTAEILRRVEAGEEIEVLHNNRPVARLVPVRTRRQWIPATELVGALEQLGPDSTGLAQEPREAFDETTDDRPW